MSHQRPMSRLVVLLLFACGSLCDRVHADDVADSLPLKKVVLFRSGVGYFEHRGEVEGDVHVDLTFHDRDVNDLLKSMVVQDADGGRITAVSYPALDNSPLSHLTIDLTNEPSLGDLLRQLRGEKVTLDLEEPVTGTIFGVQQRAEAGNEATTSPNEILTLVTDEGLRRFALKDVRGIQLTSKELDAELREALLIVAAARRNDLRRVRLEFSGKGKRRVRVGYLRQTPVWKTSYRLVLDGREPPLLQGWAIVENTGEIDWKNVDLSFVSGRPISFAMDLDRPIFIRRPQMQPEVFGTIDPQLHRQDVAEFERGFRRSRLKRQAGGGGGGGGSFGGGGVGGPSIEPKEPIDPRQGVEAVAKTNDVGELLHYHIEHPVSLAAHRSAMLPIVTEKIEAQRVSIFVSGAHAKHPLHGLKLTNTTGVDLIQGPVTVFDEGSYAGDARLGHLRDGTSQLISYALDLETDIRVAFDPRHVKLVSASIRSEQLQIVRRQKETTRYEVRNSSNMERIVLLESPRRKNWKLTEPKEPAELTDRLYRFRVAAQPGKEAKLTVVMERDEHQTLDLITIPFALREELLASDLVAAPVKETLRTIDKLETDLRKSKKQHKAAAQRMRHIASDQSRIRANMGALERTSEIYLRYIVELTQQENELASLRKQIEQDEAEEVRLLQALRIYSGPFGD